MDFKSGIPESHYTGKDNLEVMREAVNYNDYLNRLITEHTIGYQHIVDFGAGIGTFAEPLRKAGRDVICVESDPAQRALLVQMGFNCCADIAALPDGRADSIYTLNVLEHISDDRATLQQLYAKLAPGGRLLVYVPAFQILYSSMDEKVGHCRRYSRRTLSEKICAAGFRIRESRYADSLGFLATIGYKLVGSRSGNINRKTLIIYDRLIFPISRLVDTLTDKLFGKNLIVIAEKPCTTTMK